MTAMTDGVSLPEGFQASGVHAGLQPDGALDLGLIVADTACRATAVFTQNLLRGAHIPVCHDHLRRSNNTVRAVLVNGLAGSHASLLQALSQVVGEDAIIVDGRAAPKRRLRVDKTHDIHVQRAGAPDQKPGVRSARRLYHQARALGAEQIVVGLETYALTGSCAACAREN